MASISNNAKDQFIDYIRTNAARKIVTLSNKINTLTLERLTKKTWKTS